MIDGRMAKVAGAIILVCGWMPNLGRASNELAERTLRFPEEGALGAIYSRLPDAEAVWYDSVGWEFRADARGEVRVPAGHEAQLEVSRAGLKSLEWLKRLGANDIQFLNLRDLNLRDGRLTNALHLKGLRSIRLSGNPIMDAEVRLLTNFPGLISVLLNDTETTDEGVRTLARLRNLREVGLNRTRITDGALEALGKVSPLRSLDLSRTKITDAGLAHLRAATNLQSLRFSHCNITDRGLSFLRPLVKLEFLEFNRVHATDAGLSNLVALQRLQRLRIDDNPFTDEGVAPLMGLPRLESLHLSGRFSDDALKILGKIKTLKKLYLRDGDFTGEGLGHLAQLPALEELDIETEADDFPRGWLIPLTRMRTLRVLELYDFPVGRDNLQQLGDLPRLETLTLGQTKVRFEDLHLLSHGKALRRLRYAPERDLEGERPTLAGVKGLTNLTELMLPPVPVEPAEFAHLSALSKLERLDYEGRLTDEGVRHLAGLASLKELYLPESHLTDEGLRHLAGLRKLEWLRVSGPITDHGLEHLRNLKELRTLYLHTSTVSLGELEVLKQHLPRLQRLSTPLEKQFVGEEAEFSLRGLPAPDFEVTSADGQSFRLSSQRGKAVLVYFWATWCAPCLRSLPARKQLHAELSAQYGERFAMISLSRDDEEEKWRRHLARHQEPGRQARLGIDSPIAAEYRVLGAGVYFLVAPDGTVASTESEPAKLKAAVKAALE